MKLFIDTWGWYALGNIKEPAHESVKAIYKEARRKNAKIYTTDYILDETITLLFRRVPFAKARQFVSGLLQAVFGGFLILERITPERFQRAWELRQKYQDKPDISFTDLTSFAVMQELKISDVLTDDHHFLQVNLGFELLPTSKQRS